ncbi:GlcG/HbpS family heme-binding protein [Pseudodesulfovibrio sediminis]|uniref:Heme-binding protein n=1 Tax=Pseudodesulfovibrio sediminis TaxID=2810563 RepID=A0ABN6EWE3_9BACT|nr:heme-binding protein [Pseudodesulfovibrio sediminis]BCS89838.1 hypothetical protein PSDVSF_30800 [Pseudodesulfovibrio sediminis]
MPITLKDAKRMIEAAKVKADELGVPMVIAVVDGGGNLMAQERQDDALIVSIELSRDKAYSAVAVKADTATIGDLAQPGAPLFGLGRANGGRIITFGGGLPIAEDGTIIGGIGVSGGSVEEDVACATAGLNAL